jgi:predicted 3-demethylubiquinone-9 3-methyltransferase (glyoxalase superfamily)
MTPGSGNTRQEGGAAMQKFVPNLWFDTEAEEAANFYLSVFEDSRILSVTHYNEAVPQKADIAALRAAADG